MHILKIRVLVKRNACLKFNKAKLQIQRNKVDISATGSLKKSLSNFYNTEIRIVVDDKTIQSKITFGLETFLSDTELHNQLDKFNDLISSCTTNKDSSCNMLIKIQSVKKILKLLAPIVKYSGVSVKIDLKKEVKNMRKIEGQIVKINDNLIVLIQKNSTKVIVDLSNINNIFIKSNMEKSGGMSNSAKPIQRTIGKGNRSNHFRPNLEATINKSESEKQKSGISKLPHTEEMAHDVIKLKSKPMVGRKRGNALQLMEKAKNKKNLKLAEEKFSYETSNHSNLMVISGQGASESRKHINIRALRRRRLLQKELVNKS